MQDHLLLDKVKYLFSNNKLQIQNDGSIIKFVDTVYKIEFSGDQAIKYNHDILYITERAVFRLNSHGTTLEEIAPGIDLDKDVLSKMNFEPSLGTIKEMDMRLFKNDKMSVKNEFFQKVKK